MLNKQTHQKASNNLDNLDNLDNLGYVGYVGYVGSIGDVLDEIRVHLARYILTIHSSDLDVLTLWVAHTYVCEETYTSPRLLISSPVAGSGKTTVLEHLSKLAFNPLLASSASQQVLARVTGAGVTTLLLDEADRMLDPKRPGVGDLIATINSGYKVGSYRILSAPKGKGATEGWEPERLKTFSPVAMAGNSPKLPSDTLSRCLTVLLYPDLDGKVEESNWREIDECTNSLGIKLKTVLEANKILIGNTKFEVPDGCRNRLREKWSPFKQIASVASLAWANLVDELIRADIAKEIEKNEDGDIQLAPHVQLLRDIHSAIGSQRSMISSSDLVSLLVSDNPEYWSFSNSWTGKDLNPKRLSTLLRDNYGITSTRITSDTRGYFPEAFQAGWASLGIRAVNPTHPTHPTHPTCPPESEELF